MAIPLTMAGPQYHDDFDSTPKQGSTPTQDQPLDQPKEQIQPLSTHDTSSLPAKGHIWKARLNLRLFSICVDALLLVIVSLLASNSSDGTTSIIAFGVFTTLALIWNFADSVHLWTRRYHSFSPSIRIFVDLPLAVLFVILSLVYGYFGPSDHAVSGSAPSTDESHLGRRALGCFGITKALVQMILVFVAYYESTQANSPTSRSNCARNEEDIPRDEEEGLLFSEDSVSDR
ncbi:hypothetical protein FVEG_16211 [Fusarium verticillioides 7600]|uniref:MARVEL domain-containing protein n=1 Tax=Gibberella moniliformis (strain M3125 / FGSC 7600) TaxID=334819 RepID=W7M8N2_GIBM7|nr:hypothetical protein FVEG_16211 [Fusarium verticillioides 7600]EWG47923.1 hypothetical protein FVEG_16211 [Fusarium verticillioides 7600]